MSDKDLIKALSNFGSVSKAYNEFTLISKKDNKRIFYIRSNMSYRNEDDVSYDLECYFNSKCSYHKYFNCVEDLLSFF